MSVLPKLVLAEGLVRQLGLSAALFSLSLLTGCFVLPPADESDSVLTQQAFIHSWQRCVEGNLARLKSEGRGPGTAIENTLIACQGHREDVLATFPEHLQRSVHKVMVQQTWETGYAAWSHEAREVAQSVNRLLR